MGFACSIGFDVRLKTALQNEVPAQAMVHTHADGHQHEHHDNTQNHQHEEKKDSSKEQDGCCNDDVLKFQNLEKNINQQTKLQFAVPFYTLHVNYLIVTDIIKIAEAPLLKDIPYFYPPPPNILLAIQRFQI